MLRVLIIEDDRSFATDAAAVLRSEGCVVDVVATYSDAIRALGENAYDVVSLDVMMRVTPGEVSDMEALDYGRHAGMAIWREKLRSLWPKTKVVVCSVITGEQAVQAEFPQGTPFLSKPVSVANYIAAIKESAPAGA